MSNIVIDIAAEFVGKKAFKQADTATQKLGKSAKGLARNLGLAFGTAAVLAYSKAAIRASAADTKGQSQLALALKNVGLQRDAASAEAYVQRLQSEFGVVDDLLRPAYQKLAVATKNTAETQKLLNLSLDISASTGLSLESTTSALSKAYLGNSVALGKLGVGISKADLKTKSFDEITSQLAVTFAGAATTSAQTFSGQMALLNVSTANAAETIGGSLINALSSLSADHSMATLGSDIENAAKSLANFIDSIVYLKDQIGSIPGAGLVKGAFGFVGNILGRFSPQRAAELLKEIKGFQGMGNVSMSVSGQVQLKTSTAITKLTKAQTLAEKAKLKAKKDQLALDKAALALGKGKDVFDLDAIQLNAALINSTKHLGDVTSQAQLLALTNDIARLRVKQDMLDLEDAISRGDADAATAAAKKLNSDLLILGTLSSQAVKLSNIKSILDSLLPKSLIDTANLDDAIAKIIEMNRLQGLKVTPSGTVTPLPTGGGGGGNNAASAMSGDYVKPVDSATAALASVTSILEYADAATARANAMADLLDYQTAQATAKYQAQAAAQAAITLNFNAPIYTVSDQEFAANVQKAIQNNNRFGNNLDFAGAI
ncbi:hypothetical protein UFOVP1201_22 [uncultured Caudovirales phage]|uniref:Phage tail tape measure protein n=1 Tax=uncultured Caudovirales phage TaxID=2100421 RepID=A0A6J5NSC1_9CAUD|nr:hypothetical protein UFOVP788_15 [uncultured Caudovirales phage]CAB4189879.1 hypothetical protein UFOVP1201_22 [uncultured Caudovirales phage]